MEMLNSDFSVADRVTFISMRKSLQIVLHGGKWNDCLPSLSGSVVYFVYEVGPYSLLWA